LLSLWHLHRALLGGGDPARLRNRDILPSEKLASLKVMVSGNNGAAAHLAQL